MRRLMAAVSTWCVATHALLHASIFATAFTPYKRGPDSPTRAASFAWVKGLESAGLGGPEGAWVCFAYGKCFQQIVCS